LTLSTIDTLINAISSLIIVDGNKINKSLSGKEIKSKANLIILFLSILVFIIASKGYSILYLFLLADLLCCAAVITIFYGFFNKRVNSKLAASSIFCSLILGLLFFPSMDFQSSILVGNLLSKELFNPLITGNLLFISFAISIVVPLIIISLHSLRNSFK
jgi:Na+/proline symporter